MKKTSFLLAGILIILFCLPASGGKPQGQMSAPGLPLVASPAAPRVDADYGKIPLQFIPNRGQTDGRVAYYVQGQDKTIYFTAEGLTFALGRNRTSGDDGIDKKNLPGDAGRSFRSSAKNNLPESGPSGRWVVKLDFVDSNADARPVGLEKSGAVVSYFKGNPEEWKTGIPAYTKIIYRELWPGIDLIYCGTVNRMKYEFIVRPGADPSRIKLAYRGVASVEVTKAGRLKVITPAGGFEDDIPIAYQEIGGEEVNTTISFKLAEPPAVLAEETLASKEGLATEPRVRPETRTDVYGFEVGEYDRNRPLVLDPAVLVYCGYIGGASFDDEQGRGIAVDGSGNAYITGTTGSAELTFPVAVGPDLTLNGQIDAFVAKVNASGTALIYCGYIGGAGVDQGNAIAVDGSGNAYVAGYTNSTEATFPVAGGPDLSYNGGSWDAFVAKVNPAGTALDYCGYIGGSDSDASTGIGVDGSGNAYVTGGTRSTESTFPTVVGPDLTQNGDTDVFVAKVNASGTALIYCGFIGGVGWESGSGIAVDGSGHAYVTGSTLSAESSFPAVIGPDLTYNLSDAFVAKINLAGTALDYCGYIGGTGLDQSNGIAVDGSGSAYVIGTTSSTNLPVTIGPDLTFNGVGLDDDVFVAKVNASGTALIYCGYIGGAGSDLGYGIAVDGSGNAYATGYTYCTEATFPVVGGPDGTHNGGTSDAFVAKVNSAGTALDYCGYIGGSDWEEGLGIAADSAGNAYVTGRTNSTEATFPVVGGPHLTYNGGNWDAFVAKVQVIPASSIASLLPSSATAGDPAFVLSVVGSNFVNGTVVRWDGSARPTTFVSDSKLEAQIGTADLAASKVVPVTVLDPSGGISNSLDFSISGYTIGTPSASVTVTPGQSATYAMQVTPQYGPFNSAVSFSCSGLPSKCTASFLPTNVTPGANVGTTTLTLATQAASSAAAGTLFESAGFVPPALGLLLVSMLLMLWFGWRKPILKQSVRRWLAAGAVICLIGLIGSCSAGGGGNPPNTGTPKGTYQITVRGQSGSLTVSTTVTLIVR